jgi:hypothetical protein
VAKATMRSGLLAQEAISVAENLRQEVSRVLEGGRAASRALMIRRFYFSFALEV